MKTSCAALFGLLLVVNPLLAADGPAVDEKAIRGAVEAFAQAFAKGDAKAVAGLFTENGEAVGPDGDAIQGREALEAHYAGRFADAPGARIEPGVEAIKPLAPGIATVAGRSRVLGSDGSEIGGARYAATFVERDGRWLVASLRELPDAKAISHYERLKELEWLVGDWVEETEEAVVLTSIAWTDNKTYLLRTFDVRVKGKPALTGTQRIGWDPLTEQIKSWVFDDNGGYGEGLWSRAGDQWVVKATGVRPDGRTASATQVLTYVDNDHLKWKSIDRTHGNEVVEEIDEVTMVRKPPQPKK
jgi:uncharacterized protein (TIGR02246 family)